MVTKIFGNEVICVLTVSKCSARTIFFILNRTNVLRVDFNYKMSIKTGWLFNCLAINERCADFQQTSQSVC